jgi:hypothetical protein
VCRSALHADGVGRESSGGAAHPSRALSARSDASAPFSLVESFLAVNPDDPANVLVSGMSTGADAAVIYTSWDGGRTFTPARNASGRIFPGGDPMVGFDPAVAIDRTRSDRPCFVFTGHTLMVGDMGRTELATDARTGALALHGSARKLQSLPDDVLILPGAFAGSVCGRALSRDSHLHDRFRAHREPRRSSSGRSRVRGLHGE